MDSHEGKIEKRTDSLNESSITQKVRNNPWILTTIVLSILSILLLFGGFNATGAVVISSQSAGEQLINFYEDQGIVGLEVISVEEINGFYQIELSYEGQVLPFYVTKSGYLTGNSVVSIIPGQYDVVDQENVIDDSGNVEVSVDDDAFKGNENAPVTIVEFSDYECPFCGRFYSETLSQLESEYINTGKVKFVYRDFPLGFHQNAQKAAEAAECAGEFGNDEYWEMHNKLFEEGVDGGINAFKQYAKEIGLDSKKFDNCLDSGQMESEVNADLNDGVSYGVSGTPGFFINGKKLEGAQPFSAFKEIIDAELA